MRLIIAAATVAIALALPGVGLSKPPAGAFQTPARNIHCRYEKALGHIAASVRCDTDFPTRFTDDSTASTCRGWRHNLDFGEMFRVSRNGHGEAICAGDSAVVRSAPRLPVGVGRRFGAFHCRAPRRDAIRCTSPRHHGFSLDPSDQSVF
jgi:hypothetical protein